MSVAAHDVPGQAGVPGETLTVGKPPALRRRAYADARRHSGRVRLLKLVIPVGAVLAVAALIFVAFFNPFGQIGTLTLGPFTLSDSKIAMQNPRLTGYRNDTRPYEVTASAAYQDVRKPTVIELKQLNIKLATDDRGNTANVASDLGVFDTQKEQLELKENALVTTNTGQKAELRSALVDLKGGTVVSKEPVKVTLTNGVIEADTLNITESGKIVSFQGRVRSVFEGAKDQPAQAPGSSPSRAAPAGTQPVVSNVSLTEPSSESKP